GRAGQRPAAADQGRAATGARERPGVRQAQAGEEGSTMSAESQQIVSKAWNFAHVLRDVGLSYMAYTEQITFLLFLKMAHELTQPPHGRKPMVPAPYDWPNLFKREGDELEIHYRHTLEELGRKPGMLGQICLKARP